MYLYLRATRSLLHHNTREWAEALEEASSLARHPELVTLTRIIALHVIGLAQVRRGADDGGALDEALVLAERTGELMRLGPVRAARAEAAWLAGDAPRAVGEARAVLDDALRRRQRWLAGELALLLARAGERDLPEEGLAEPFALQIRGEWRRAAEIWRERGCPLEEARALADGDEEAVRQAWTIFDRLGARPDAAMATRRLREFGAHQVPRGPRASTRANPALLTEREIEVLALLAKGVSNRDIAAQLYLSPKTVGHHVSSILGKLDVTSRAEAGEAAIRLAILPDGKSRTQR
jgi:DNA-binding CsgD family transcriptional regulator